MKTLLCKLFLCLYFLSISYIEHSVQTVPSSPILFIYDASNSMWGQINGVPKKEIAAFVLESCLSELPTDQIIGLMVYGHRRKSDCTDVELILGLENIAKDSITTIVEKISPKGKTPLARSAKKAFDLLIEKDIAATIILITDGIESCDGDICSAVKEAKSIGIEFKLHIVGFGIEKQGQEQLKCAATEGGGMYFDAKDEVSLSDGLTQATQQSVDKSKGNFSVMGFKNGIPIDVFVKAKTSDGATRIIEGRSYRDSAFLNLPNGNYNVEVKGLEGLDVSPQVFDIQIKDEETLHKNINFDAGKISVFVSNNFIGTDAIVKVLDSNSQKVIASTRTYSRTQIVEVDPGIYDIEFKSLKIKGPKHKVVQKSVSVLGGEELKIEQNFDSGILSIGVQTKSGELIDAVIKIRDRNTNIVVASSRSYTSISSNPKSLVVNPGSYEVEIMTLGKHKGSTKTIPLLLDIGQTLEQIIKF